MAYFNLNHADIYINNYVSLLRELAAAIERDDRAEIIRLYRETDIARSLYSRIPGKGF